MEFAPLLTAVNEGNLLEWLEQYRSYGAIFSILLAFLISFIPPLPTMAVVGLNAASSGLWAGFVYSWLGVMIGIILVFVAARKLAHLKYIQRLSHQKIVQKSLKWIEKNGFLYLFMFSLMPFGPFTLVHIAAGLSEIRMRSFLIATALGRAIMIFIVSYIGADFSSYMDNPWKLVPLVAFIAAGIWFVRWLEQWFSRNEQQEPINPEFEQEPQGCK